IIYKCIYRGHRVGTVNWAPGSNYTMVIQPGNATGALALWGEKGGKPLEPLAPRMDIPRLTPLVDAPAAGVPVVTLEENKIPTEWLLAGPFEQHVNQHVNPYYDYQDVDCLASAGGEAKVKPVPGMKVQFKNQSIEWKSISAANDPKLFFSRFDGGRKTVILDSSAVPGSKDNMHIYYYTELQNNTPGYYEIVTNFYEGRSVINGIRVNNGDIVYLDKGRYSVLVPVAMGDGEYVANFSVRKSTEEKATAYYTDPARQAAYLKNKASYDTTLAAWEANGERNQQWIGYADMLRHLNYMNIQYGMGDGGFQGEGEGYTLECAAVEHDFAVQYQNAFGRSITGRPDISHFAPRYIETTIWNTVNRENNGNERPINQTYGRGGGQTIPGHYFARSIALCPKEWQPALLWFWMKREGTTVAEVRTEAGAKKLFSDGEYDAMSRVQAFINFPLDVEAKSPDTIMPHTWYASGKGLSVFRDNWKDNVSTVAQIYAKQGMYNGWSQPEGACFQIRGLGHEWAYKNNDGLGKTGTRWYDNVVILPDDAMDSFEHMQVTKFVGDEKTGSGAVSINMDKMLRSRGADIHGIRSFATDYGVEGTPAVFAVVDHFTGGKTKIWNFQLPREGGKLNIDGNTFSITNGDTTFKATFVGDKDVKIAIKTVDVSEDAHKGTKASHTSLQATSADGKGGDFFVVMTLQKGTAPEVKSEGEGINTKATVAGRTITFDGTILNITK
ncbi:MAG: hypothetical protein WCJ56_07765, partial [bacterium]